MHEQIKNEQEEHDKKMNNPWVVVAHDHPWWKQEVEVLENAQMAWLIKNKDGETDWVGGWVIEPK